MLNLIPLKKKVGKGTYGDIAIDDVSFNDGQCPLSNSCDFESIDLCGYKNDLNSGFSWNRVQGTDADSDHSYETSTGHYMIAKSLSPHSKSRLARFVSQLYPATTICVSFWYKAIGDIQLNVRTNSYGAYNPRAAFSALGDRGKYWLLGRATLSYSASYQIVFEAVDQGVGLRDGEVWLDDIEINYKACQPVGTCDFEDGLCGFTSLKSSDFNWIILDGQFGIDITAWDVPTYDHTTGIPSGQFIYLDTNYKPEGKRAMIESELINEYSGLQCIQFYLKTNRNNQATLKISRKMNNDNSLAEVFTSTSEYIGEGWFMKEVQLQSLNVSSSFIIEGVTGKSSGSNLLGQLAVDDVKLYNGTCIGTLTPPGQFNCQNGQLIDYGLVCDFKNDCSNGFDEKYCGTCDFESDDLCGWSDKSSGSYKWIRTRNESMSSNIGPNVDHTFNTQNGIGL